VGLLKADSVAVIIAHHTVFNHGPKAAVEENSRATATVQGNILVLVAINCEILYAHTFQITPTDDCNNGLRLRLLGHQAIRIEWLIDREGVAALSGDAS